MIADILNRLFIANLAAAVALLLVLAIRRPARKIIGARTAYALWLIVPAALLACLIPPPTFTRAVSAAPAVQTLAQQPLDLSPLIAGAWIVGIAAFIVFIIIGQYRAVAAFGLIGSDKSGFARAANLATGPALIGLLRPTVVLPADFEDRFAPGEQAMILAHERTHLLEGHLWINALVGVVRAINWFNPLLHLGAYYARVDQELACDAAVVERYPGERRTYAEAMLKSQIARSPLPLGCSWPARSTPMLKERLEMLANEKPALARRLAGAAAITLLAAAAGYGAWAAQPPSEEIKIEVLQDSPLPPRVDVALPAPVSRVSLSNAGARPAASASAQAPSTARVVALSGEGFVPVPTGTDPGDGFSTTDRAVRFVVRVPASDGSTPDPATESRSVRVFSARRDATAPVPQGADTEDREELVFFTRVPLQAPVQ